MPCTRVACKEHDAQIESLIYLDVPTREHRGNTSLKFPITAYKPCADSAMLAKVLKNEDHNITIQNDQSQVHVSFLRCLICNAENQSLRIFLCCVMLCCLLFRLTVLMDLMHPLITRLVVQSPCFSCLRQSVLGQDSKSQIARSGQASTLCGSLLTSVCESEWEANCKAIWIKALYKCIHLHCCFMVMQLKIKWFHWLYAKEFHVHVDRETTSLLLVEVS